MIKTIGLATIRRYEGAWQRFWNFQLAKYPQFSNKRFHASDLASVCASLPLWKLALSIKRFADATSIHQARNAYSAFMLFPACQQLRYEALLRPLKRKWGSSKPKYSSFYEVEPILGLMMHTPLPCT